jgi:hypothetical protein
MLELMADICILRLVTWNCKSLTAALPFSELAEADVTLGGDVAVAVRVLFWTMVLFSRLVELVVVELAVWSGIGK